MVHNKFEKIQRSITGYNDQEILIKMMSTCISDIVDDSTGIIEVHMKQGLLDALNKRKKEFKDLKYISKNEKITFLNELVINTIKRAKLVASADEIIPECIKIYDEWKREYRPQEV